MKAKNIYYLCLLLFLMAANVASREQIRRRDVSILQLLATNRTLMASSSDLQTNCAALVERANNVGFAAALFGYSARDEGIDAGRFAILARDIFSGTNQVNIEIELGTNIKRRL